MSSLNTASIAIIATLNCQILRDAVGNVIMRGGGDEEIAHFAKPAYRRAVINRAGVDKVRIEKRDMKRKIAYEDWRCAVSEMVTSSDVELCLFADIFTGEAHPLVLACEKLDLILGIDFHMPLTTWAARMLDAGFQYGDADAQRAKRAKALLAKRMNSPHVADGFHGATRLDLIIIKKILAMKAVKIMDTDLGF